MESCRHEGGRKGEGERPRRRWGRDREEREEWISNKTEIEGGWEREKEREKRREASSESS